MNVEPILSVVFFRTAKRVEPVRDWLRGLDTAAKKIIGTDIKTVQFGWPNEIPRKLVKKSKRLMGSSQ
jgi:hypothetical protein